MITGGAGADSITANAGFDSLTLVPATTQLLGSNISLSDTIDGGAGTDSLTGTIGVATAQGFASVSNVENATLDFTAAGSYNASGTSMSVINVTAGAGIAATVNNIATGQRIDLEDTHLDGVTLDYAADATASISLDATAGAQTTDALTVTDAQTVNISTAGGADTTLDAVQLDNTDTDFLTITAGVAGRYNDRNDVTADDVQTVTLTTSATNAH